MFYLVDVSLWIPVVLVIISYFAFRPKRNLPPGPWNIPFCSGIFKIEPEAHVTFRAWAKQYGPLIRTKIGLKETLIIDDVQLMHEAFTSGAVDGRPHDLVFDVLSNNRRGITFADGEQWAEQRRFAVRTLRDFGFGKRSMESFLMDEVTEFMKWMNKNEGVPVEVNRRIVLATVSALWTLLAGERQQHEDKILDDIIEKSTQGLSGATEVNGIISRFPQLLKILPKKFLTKWYQFVENNKPFQNVFVNAVKEHIDNPVDKDHPRDLIDVYLTEINNTKDPKSSFYKDVGRENLEIVLTNIYGAATCTTSSLLTWTILYLVRFPEAQRKLQVELDAVIGRSRLPCLNDKQNLPYTEALTREVFRFASILPLGLSHETSQDIKLGGYDIQKGTVVIPNLWSMNYNKEVWGDPENFRPERFLSPDEKSVLKIKDYINFGVGKRVCLGEALGRDNYFLFLTSMFQKFQILPDPANPTPSLEGGCGMFRDAKRFTVVMKER